jgi:penicillin amidase
VAPPPGAEALHALLLGWDGHMDPASTAAAKYITLRRELVALLAERSGLGALAGTPMLSVAPGIVPRNQLWLNLPALLRANDTRLLGGWNWEQMLEEALRRTAAEPTDASWGEIHRPRLAHPLSSLFPQHAALLDPQARAIGGDNECVWANGMLAASGPAATYGALARYVFDVGDWDNCRWTVFHGVSGQPGSPHYADQNEAWSNCRMVPMRYSWNIIAAEATATQTLSP